ncbi:DnaB-like helicase C-terminal domain-containing protein [Microvirga sp. 0TCS3.31]
MISARDLPDVMEQWAPPAQVASTGIASLDRLTAGMAPGRVWLVVGNPGEGRTTLLAQWAAAIARVPDQHVHLVAPREMPHAIAARLHSMLGLVPLDHLTSGRDDESEQRTVRLERARERLEASSMSVYARGDDAYVPEVHPWRAAAVPTAIVLDDADMVSGLTPLRVREYAEASMFVLLSLPRAAVFASPGGSVDLDPSWARVADVVLEVEHRGVGTPSEPRPGEADLHVHYNRHGYVRTVAVQHQAHFSRFVEMGLPARREPFSHERGSEVQGSPHALAQGPAGP